MMQFEFPALPYAFDALEPHIDARTMEIHYTKHHRAYFDKFIAALDGSGDEDKSLETLFSNISQAPAALRNNGGGYYNHILFWENMSPAGGGSPTGKLASALETQFGSFEQFKATFEAAAASRFGSGWAWLIFNRKGQLEVCSTPNQDNPLMDVSTCKGIPLLALDVWEHAYYLHYQNRRPAYITAFWNVVNWEQVAKKFNQAQNAQ